MRGFPFLNLIISLLLSGAVVFPLVYRATRVAARDVVEKSAAAPEERAPFTPAHVSLRFDHTPQKVSLRSGGQLLHEWTAPAAGATLEESIRLPLTDGRAELAVRIDWPAGTQGTPVAELRVEPDGMASRSANIWSAGGTADEVVTLSWKGDES